VRVEVVSTGFRQAQPPLNPSASGWVGLSLRRVLGFGGRVRGGKPSTNENHDDEWTMCKREWFRQAQPNGFGVGGRVRAAGCEFRRARPWGGQRTLSRTHGRERMDGAQMGVASRWVGLSLGGFWVSAGVAGGKERMKDER